MENCTDLLDKLGIGVKQAVLSRIVLAHDGRDMSDEEFEAADYRMSEREAEVYDLFLKMVDLLDEFKFYLDDLERNVNRAFKSYEFLLDNRDELDEDELVTVYDGLWFKTRCVSQGFDTLWDIAGSSDREKYKAK